MIQSPKKEYDLEERTTKFSEQIIGFFKKSPKDIITIPIINQSIRSGTSIGANYCEANGACSKKDFHNKICTCKKEAKETMYWLRLLTGALDEISLKEECQILWKESKEFAMIFTTIATKSK